VLDKPDEQNDRRLARHLVALHYESPEVRHVIYVICELLAYIVPGQGSQKRNPLAQVEVQEGLDLPTLTSYISYARQHYHPKLSDEAAEDLINGYVAMRHKGNFPGSSKKISVCPLEI
jgi:DNA replication licensing factor MCM4